MPLGWVRFHGMGRTPGAALGLVPDEYPHPLPHQCKSDSVALTAAGHLIALGFLRAIWSLKWTLRFALPGFCSQRLVFVAAYGWNLSFNILGLLLLLGRLLFCCFGGPAPCVVFLFLLVLWLEMVLWCWSLLLVFVFWYPGLLGCFSFFWWLCVGAWGLLPAWGVRLLPSRGCVGHCLVVFIFWCSGVSAFSCLPLQFLLMVCVAFCASGLLLLLLFFLFLFPFLPLLGFLLLWLSVFSVISFLLPLPGIAWCLAFPCAWFDRPLLTSFCCCYCFALNCMGLVVMVAVKAVVVMVVVVVVVRVAGVCSPLVYGQRLFTGVVVVVSVCSPLGLVRLVGGGICSPLVWGQHLFVGMVDGWCLFAFGFGVVGWWSAFFSPLVWGQRLFAGVVAAGVCSPLILVWLVGGGVCSPVVAPCLLAG